MQTTDMKSPTCCRINCLRAGAALLLCAGLATLAALGPFARAAEAEKSKPAAADDLEAQKEALGELNAFIGDWRGVGMPRRGSRVGAWTETATWVWEFEKGTVAVDYKIDKGKQLQNARVSYDPANTTYHLKGTFADKVEREYTGKLDDDKLVFESKPDDDGYVHLITLTDVNEKRSLVLYQKRRENSKFLSRVAEVGYTRAGTSLAFEGAGEIECIVTGGKGTIAVSYKGETYYVCCSGCKMAFDDDPAGVIAAYKEKVAKRKKERAAGKKS